MPELDVRCFADVIAYLNEWCAEHPERTTFKSIEELARFAGCSWGLMARVLDRKTRLSLSFVGGLTVGLGLEGESAVHLRQLAELQFAPPEQAMQLRLEIWKRFGQSFGLPWEEAAAQLHEPLANEHAIAALGPALAALGDEAPAPKRLVARSIVPLREDQIAAATASLAAWEAYRTAPRLVALPPPTDAASTALWQGVLGRTIETIGRVQPGQMRCWTAVASVDGEAEAALKKTDGRLYAKLEALAAEAELRPANRLVWVLFQQLPLTSPQRVPEPNGPLRWYRTDGVLRALQHADKGEKTMESAALPSTAPTKRAARGSATAPLPLGYLDFPTYLAAWRAWRALRREQHSEGFIARVAGLTPATVHDLAHGRTRLGPQHTPGFIKLFGIAEDLECQAALEGMSQIVAGHGPEVQGKLALTLRHMGAQRQRRHPDTEAWFVRSRWYALAIHLLAELPGFQPSTGRIGRALLGRVTWTAIEEALVALATLGLLRQEPDGTVVAADPGAAVKGALAEQAQFQLHTGALRLYRAELDLGEVSLGLSGRVLALPDKALPYLDRYLDEFYAELRAILTDAEARRQAGAPMDRLVLLSYQAFPQILFPTRRRP